MDAGILGTWNPGVLGPRRRSPARAVFQIPRIPARPSARVDGGTLRDGIAKQVSIFSGVPASCPEPTVNVLHIRRRFWGASQLMPGCIAELACSDDVGLGVRSPIATGNQVLCCAFEPPYLTFT